MTTFEEALLAKPDTDRARPAADAGYYGVMAPGCLHHKPKDSYSSSAAFPKYINLMSGFAHSAVRRGVSADAAADIERRYGTPVPQRLIIV